VNNVKAILSGSYENYTDTDPYLYDILKAHGLLENPKLPEYGDYVTALLIITTSCNLRCKYCLAGEGSYGTKRMVMSREVIDSTISYLKKRVMMYINKCPESEYVPFGLFFFGGEPLLYPELIKYAVTKAKEKARSIEKETRVKAPLSSSISTNGTLINDDIAKFFEENNIEVIISIDGPEHDKYRIYANGKGSLNDTIKGFEVLKKYNIQIRVNSVVPFTEIKNIDNRIKWFKETLLPKPSPKIYITFSFVRGLVGNAKENKQILHDYVCLHNYSIEDIKIYEDAIMKLVDEGYLTYEFEILRKIEMGGTLFKCLSGIERIAIMPDGSVYPCQSFIDERFKLGNIRDKNFDHSQSYIVRNFLMKRTILNLTPCKDCWLQSVCSLRFDCPSHSYYDHGGLFNIDREACEAGYVIQSKILEKLIKNKVEEETKIGRAYEL